MPTTKSAQTGWDRLGPDKALFIVVFAVGCSMIVALDFLGASKLIAVGICVGLMLGYASATGLVPALKLRPDQCADNSYYMGLLFTLTSLGVALYRFAGSDMAAQAILRNFGIAIFTTIAGLMLRVLISQFRQDPEDLEYEAKEALAETVRALRGQLDQSLAEMQSFAVGVRQTADETITQIERRSIETLTASLQQFSAVAGRISSNLAVEAEGISQAGRAVIRGLDDVGRSLDGLAERIADVEVKPDSLTEAVRPAFGSLSEAVGGLAKDLRGQGVQIGRSLTKLNNLSNSIERLDAASSAFAAITSALQTALGPLQQVQRGLSDLEAGVRGAAQAAETLGGAEPAAKALAGTLAGLNRDFGESHAAVAQVRRELAEIAAWMIARLDQEA